MILGDINKELANEIENFPREHMKRSPFHYIGVYGCEAVITMHLMDKLLSSRTSKNQEDVVDYFKLRINKQGSLVGKIDSFEKEGIFISKDVYISNEGLEAYIDVSNKDGQEIFYFNQDVINLFLTNGMNRNEIENQKLFLLRFHWKTLLQLHDASTLKKGMKHAYNVWSAAITKEEDISKERDKTVNDLNLHLREYYQGKINLIKNKYDFL